MRRVEFNKRIELYTVGPVADGYGGNTVSETLVGTYWAKVEPINQGTASTEYGLLDAANTVRFTVRKGDDAISKEYFVKYRTKTYEIVSGPIELNFDNKFLQFVGQTKG
jgi:SPP1 family predicted phage head-tail adaptor